jgi:hypothetical protein
MALVKGRNRGNSALGELGSLAGFFEAVLAALLGPRVTAEVALNLQGFAVIGRKIAKGAGCALLDGISLTGQTTTPYINEEVVLGFQTKGLEGSLY